MLEQISRRERWDIFVSWVAISLAFTIIKVSPGGIFGFKLSGIGNIIPYFIISLLTVGIGFAVHEMAHKFTAIRYGYWAEFKKSNSMLVIALALASFIGLIFAAPGATVVYIDNKGISTERNGKISAAGPFINLVLCIPFIVIMIIGFFLVPFTTIVKEIGIFGIQINAMFAVFNMIPISILDGKKVLAWNRRVFAELMILSVIILLLSFTLR